MVRNALLSIKNLNYDDWHLAFIDDGSIKPGKPVAEEILKEHLDKVTFYNTEHSIDDKNRQGGSMVGVTMNQALADSNAEMAIMLCDDDALVPSYFSDLREWSMKNPDSHYCYSHVILYNPFEEKPHEEFDSPFLLRKISHQLHKFNRRKCWYNKTQQVYPEAKLDASQVAWRTYCNDKALFPARRTCHLDSAFYRDLGQYYGFFGQYKGLHDDTLSIRDEDSRHIKFSKIYKVQDLDKD